MCWCGLHPRLQVVPLVPPCSLLLAAPHSLDSRCSMWHQGHQQQQQEPCRQEQHHQQQQEGQMPTVSLVSPSSSSSLTCGWCGLMRTAAWRSGEQCCQSMQQHVQQQPGQARQQYQQLQQGRG